MSWWEWVLVVSTIGHAIADPPGRKVSDYECAPTETDCEGLGEVAAILKCEKCISDHMWTYVLEWIGSGPPSDGRGYAAALSLRRSPSGPYHA